MLKLAYHVAKYGTLYGYRSIRGLIKTRQWDFAAKRLRFSFTRKIGMPYKVWGYPVQTPMQAICLWEVGIEGHLFNGWSEDLDQKERPVIIDVGANLGIFGWLCRKRWPDARIIGIEAHPQWAEHTRHLHCYDEVRSVALMDKPGKAVLSLSNGHGAISGTTAKPEGEFSWYTAGQIEVQGIDLDSLNLPGADVIKVDIDGAEFMAWVGGRKTFAAARNVVMECVGKRRVHTMESCLERRAVKLGYDDYLFRDPLL